MFSYNHYIDEHTSVKLVETQRLSYRYTYFDIIFSSKWGKVKCSLLDENCSIFIYVISCKYNIIDKLLGYELKENRLFHDINITNNMKVTENDVIIRDAKSCITNQISVVADKSIIMNILLKYSKHIFGFDDVLPIHYLLCKINIPTDIITNIKKILAIEIADILYDLSDGYIPWRFCIF